MKEKEIVDRIRMFSEWVYNINYNHYPEELNFHARLYTENRQIPTAYDRKGKVVRPAEPGRAPYRKTACNTFCEAILVDAWMDTHTKFGWDINNQEHNLWVNAADLNYNNRLRVIEPSLVKLMGKCIYAIEKDAEDNILTKVFNQNSTPSESTPFPNEGYNDVLPEPWTLVQHFNNSYNMAGHMSIILDYDQKTLKRLVLEAASGPSIRRAPNTSTNGPRVTGLFHVDCLSLLPRDSLTNEINTSTHKITQEWASQNSVSTTWEGLRDNVKGLVLVKLYVYDLRLTRPPNSEQKRA